MTLRRAALSGAAAVAVAAMTATALAAPAWAGTGRDTGRGTGHQALHRAMETVVEGGTPGVTAQARDGRGVWRAAVGTGDLRTGKPRGTEDRFRVASITKTFVATVLLQMEAEGKLDLDDTVDRWLPGLVRGNGHDGREITVRQLLNHTSGVYDFLNDQEYLDTYVLAPGFLEHRYETRTPQAAVDVAMSHAPDFAPGTRHQYSNTNYVLAGLIIEAVGGNTYEDEVRSRIIGPLKLRGTVMPGDTWHMPRPSSRAYSTLSLDPAATKIYDVTEQNASQSWADGDIISTTGDLNRFLTALLRGELLPPAQLKAMLTAVPVPDEEYSGYGLGIGTYRTSCGTTVWGHSGGWLGSLSEVVSTADGRHSLAYNLNGDWSMSASLVEAEFCGVTGGSGRAAAPGDRLPRKPDATGVRAGR
ncbi:beta-lactamase family protein [Streptomyces pactum]|uniref:Beta-lactamase family protein n=1 Tax=Streptomyces pactum TaxID=68249 RepID=A0ABS0NFI0_9ACTN|nr:serine hydrolase domain-containing protein [Streptomyces pactum]MBH5333960.1 beta-lactamase family protein [Streptomyces pactum]